MTDHIVAGTGSRRLQTADNATKRAAMALLTAKLEERLSAHPGLVVMSGGAEGFDAALALAALNLEIPLWLAIPHMTYGAHYWGRKSVTGTNRLVEFQRIVGQATTVTYVMRDVHGTDELYLGAKHANFVRNDFMVQAAQEFLVWDPTSRGTKHCLEAIKRAGKPYEVLSAPAPLPAGG